MNLEEKILEILKSVKDPELKLDVVFLGLVRDIKINEANKVTLTMTLTSPACPYASEFLNEVKNRVNQIDGVNEVDIKLSFSPPWEPPKEVRELFGWE